MQNPDVKPHKAERSLTFELRPLKVSFLCSLMGSAGHSCFMWEPMGKQILEMLLGEKGMGGTGG